MTFDAMQENITAAVCTHLYFICNIKAHNLAATQP